MIEFRQKKYSVLGLTAMIAPGMIQSHNQNKKNTELQEDFQRQNAKLQERQTEVMNKIAKAAEKDPSKAQAVVNLQQNSYSVVSNALKTGGQVVYDFARGIGKKQIAKTVGSGLALGTTMAIGNYAVDKAIQADRKRITGGAPLPVPQKPKEQVDQERKKKIRKLATGATVLAGSVLAARKGYLGKGFENLSKGLTKSGTKINGKEFLKVTGHELKQGINGKSILSGIGFGALFGLPYIGERKQLKEQVASQQKQYAEVQQEDQQQKKRGSVLKKAAIGTAATIGTLATIRRVGPVGMRKGINDLYMTYGNKLANGRIKNLGGEKIGNWMMKSGAKQWGKAQAKVTQGILESRVSNETATRAYKNLRQKNLDKLKTGKYKYDPEGFERYVKKLEGTVDITKRRKARSILNDFNLGGQYAERAGNARLNAIKSGKVTRKAGEGLLGGISGFFGMGKQKTTGFLTRMARDTNNSDATRNVAKFLDKHKRTALVGATGLGLVAWKPFEWGDAAVKKAAGVVDKNAFAYEKSKEQQVPNE